ncbi:MAG: hypothetical protein IJW54_02530 [Clostridia bacterium]|nr:hypothetical protein [Clostridia bacterium]
MNEIRKPRVLITYVEAGLGHIVTAKAISDSLKTKYNDQLEIIDSFILRDSKKEVLNKFERWMVNEVRKHSMIPGYCAFQMACMHIIGSKNTLKFVHNTKFRAASKALIEEYKEINPDVIVCTHYFTLHIAIKYRNKFSPKTLVINYCPDNIVHGWWDNRGNRFYTNNPIATNDTKKNHFKKDTVKEVFFPTRNNVTSVVHDKDKCKENFNIPKDSFTVVFTNGFYATKKTKKVFNELAKIDLPFNLCILVGKNEELRAYFDKLKASIKPNINLITFGYLDNAPELYATADLFITKGGPNAILDSVLVGTPILVDFYASPIEKASTRLFTRELNCGIFEKNPKKIKHMVESFISNPDMLKPYIKSINEFNSNPNGADDIADDMIDLMKQHNMIAETEPALV